MRNSTSPKKEKRRGFTLLELMIVLAIIAVFIALAVPGIHRVNQRNRLVNLVNMVQREAVNARMLALKSRRAAVLEVRNDRVWVDHRLFSACGGGTDNDIPTTYPTLALSDANNNEACILLCAGLAWDDDLSTTAPTLLAPNNGFALCYSGEGRLFVRNSNNYCFAGGGAGNPCDNIETWIASQGNSGGQPTNAAFADGTSILFGDGAALLLNRYGDSCNPATLPTCTGGGSAGATDVAHFVFFPSSGTPYTRTRTGSD